MDLSTALLCAVAALLGFNNLLFKIPRWHTKRFAFWMLQSINLGTIVALLTIGIPGFSGATAAINWVLGLLLVMHVVSNNGKLVRAVRDAPTATDPEVETKRAQLKAALSRGSEE